MAKNTDNISITVDKDFLEEVGKFVEENKEDTNRNRSNWFVFALKSVMEEKNKLKKNSK